MSQSPNSGGRAEPQETPDEVVYGIDDPALFCPDGQMLPHDAITRAASSHSKEGGVADFAMVHQCATQQWHFHVT